ncbi:hypothetical protein B0H14DRAFT_3126277 [Mycena olivaceomarginata]|nr:hypothetical protein B0H14DRAFT_3126277 [Mycena olivaceomarginata]
MPSRPVCFLAPLLFSALLLSFILSLIARHRLRQLGRARAVPLQKTQNDAWLKPSEENISANVRLRVELGHFRVLPYENQYLVRFEAALVTSAKFLRKLVTSGTFLSSTTTTINPRDVPDAPPIQQAVYKPVVPGGELSCSAEASTPALNTQSLQIPRQQHHEFPSYCTIQQDVLRPLKTAEYNSPIAGLQTVENTAQKS